MSALVDPLVDLLNLFSTIITTSAPWFWIQMALENLGLGLALSWIYDAFTTREPEPSEGSKFLAERREARTRGKSRSSQELETASKEESHSGEHCSIMKY